MTKDEARKAIREMLGVPAQPKVHSVQARALTSALNVLSGASGDLSAVEELRASRAAPPAPPPPARSVPSDEMQAAVTLAVERALAARSNETPEPDEES